MYHTHTVHQHRIGRAEEARSVVRLDSFEDGGQLIARDNTFLPPQVEHLQHTRAVLRSGTRVVGQAQPVAFLSVVEGGRGGWGRVGEGGM